MLQELYKGGHKKFKGKWNKCSYPEYSANEIRCTEENLTRKRMYDYMFMYLQWLLLQFKNFKIAYT